MAVPLYVKLALVVSLIPVITGILSYKLLTRELKILMGFLIISFSVAMVSTHIAFTGKSNMMVFHIYTLVEYTFLIIIFSYWQKIKAVKTGLLISIPLFTLIWIIVKLFLEDPLRFDNFTSSLECAVLVSVSAYTLFSMVGENLKSLYREPRLWVSTAVLIYFSGNLITFALSSIIVIWTIHNVLHIIADLCYAGGFLCLRRR